MKVTTRAIARELRAHPPKVRYALEKLKKEGLIEVVKVHKNIWYIKVR